MDGKLCSLSDDVFAVFERACREQDFETAEHLLKALEAMAERTVDDDAQLQRAYLVLARSPLERGRLC